MLNLFKNKPSQVELLQTKIKADEALIERLRKGKRSAEETVMIGSVICFLQFVINVVLAYKVF